MYTLRSHVDSIFFEFLYCSRKNTCVIICDGLPTTNPSKKDVMLSLGKLGYSSIALRYEGTRESKGEFLSHKPSDDVRKVIDYIKHNKIIDYYNNIGYDFSTMKLILLGSSFGGAVVLDMLNCDDISKFIVTSPVISLDQHNIENNEENLYEIEDFIVHGLGNAYRFSHENWLKMCNGALFSTDFPLLKKRAQDVCILYDQSDTKVSGNKISNIAHSHGIKHITEFSGYGHISYSKFDLNIMNSIEEFIDTHHTLSCGLICIKDSKILFTKDRNGDWGLPKGLNENNELREETCRRELKEELGVDININNDIEPLIINYKAIFGGIEVYKTAVFFVGAINSAELLLDNNEIIDYKYYSLHEAQSISINKSLLDHIKNYVVASNLL